MRKVQIFPNRALGPAKGFEFLESTIDQKREIMEHVEKLFDSEASFQLIFKEARKKDIYGNTIWD